MGDTPSPVTDPIVESLRAARKEQGLSQQQLGEKLGRRSYQTAWQWEHGVDIRLSNLRAWADALGYDITLTKRDES